MQAASLFLKLLQNPGEERENRSENMTDPATRQRELTLANAGHLRDQVWTGDEKDYN
jgi:hypothetical protein